MMPTISTKNREGTMKKKKLYVAQMPAVSSEFARALNQRFPAATVKPGMSQDELLYSAGQRSVVEYILSVATGTTISGDPLDIKPDQVNQSLLKKVLGILQ